MNDELSDNLNRLLGKTKELFNKEGFNQVSIDVLDYSEEGEPGSFIPKRIELKITAKEQYKATMENVDYA